MIISKIKIIKFATIVVSVFSTVTVQSCKENNLSPVIEPVTANNLSFVPSVLSPNVEIGNPARGFYQWENDIFPNVLPVFDIYKRFSWRLIEPTKDVYDFTVIDNQLNALKTGQRFSFRIMAFNSLNHNAKGIDVPDYIETEGRGWTIPYNNTVGSSSMFVPDWNDSELLIRMEKLCLVLAAKYDNDPRIGWIEDGLYGNWGEWHNYPVQYPNSAGQYTTPPGTFTGNAMYNPIYAPKLPDSANPSTQKYREGSTQTIQRILLAHTNAFTLKQLIHSTSNLPSLFLALNQTREKPTGIRRDSWGDQTFKDITKNNPYKPTASEWVLFNERWKEAPFYTENWGGAILSETEMLSQLAYFNVSAIAYGGIGVWTSLSADTQASFLKYARASGYRYQISQANIHLNDSILSLKTSWRNINMAPSYENWSIKAYIINPKTNELTSSKTNISVNLKSLLNGTTTPINDSITFKLNEGWKNEKILHLRILVEDNNNYLKPLNLDMSIQNADGSYTLCIIEIINGVVQLKRFN